MTTPPVYKNSATGILWLLLVALAARSATAGSKNFTADAIGDSSGKPAYPQVFNLASRASVTANATCGELMYGPEPYCKYGGSATKTTATPQCSVCEPLASDPTRRHGPSAAVDDSMATWWQSPSLRNGDQYHYVTFTIDLKQVYQVSHIILKFGISSRPGNWILERSTDGGMTYKPWQYFAVNSEECVHKYGVQMASYTDKNVQVYPNATCITSFSRFKPYENAEIHINLLKGHSSLNLLSSEVMDFASAQHIRMRFEKIIFPNDKYVLFDESLKHNLFYTIRDIFIGGRCLCNGHAKKCKQTPENKEPSCECLHNTCGKNCDKCCPLFNQRPWKSGSLICEKCQCHGHATECQYDPIVAKENSSLDIYGTYSGGGICINCTKHTTGTNCDICEIGWYRPSGVKPDDPEPCLPCDCHPTGSDGNVCIPDKDTGVGLCNCIEGYDGAKCNECAPGYNGFPDCKPCSCNENGVKTAPLSCENECICKVPIS